MKVTIYRLEDCTNTGPFTSGIIYCYTGWVYSDPIEFPNPYNDGIGYDWKPGVHFCGCKSLRQLLHWFPAKVIRQMRQERQFGIAVYEVDMQHVVAGSKQVMFALSEAKRILFK